MTHSKIFSYGPLAARLLLALLFLVSGFGMLTNFGGTVGYFSTVGIPIAALAVVLVLIVKLGGGLMVATGIHAKEGAWALIVFTLLTIVIAHIGEGQMINALKNLAIVGGLLMIALGGPGPMNWSKKCPCPRCKHGKAAGGVCQPAGMCMCGTCEECTGKAAPVASMNNEEETDESTA